MNRAQAALIRLHDAVTSFLRDAIAADARLLRHHGATTEEIRTMLTRQQRQYDQVEGAIMDEAIAFVGHSLPERYSQPGLLH